MECVGWLLGHVLFVSRVFVKKLYPVKKERVRKISEIQIICEKKLALNIGKLEHGRTRKTHIYTRNLISGIRHCTAATDELGIDSS